MPYDLPEKPSQNLTVTREYLDELYGEVRRWKNLAGLTAEQRERFEEIRRRPLEDAPSQSYGAGPQGGRSTELSDCEVAVIADLADGLSAAESAARQTISAWTLMDHRKKAYAKLGVAGGNTRTVAAHAVAVAFRRGLVA